MNGNTNRLAHVLRESISNVAGVSLTTSSCENIVQQLLSELSKQVEPADPMDTRLPCDVTVGSGTFCKGVKLRLFVMRMRAIYSDWERMMREKYPDVAPTPFFMENTGIKDGELVNLSDIEHPMQHAAPDSPEAEKTYRIADTRYPIRTVDGGVLCLGDIDTGLGNPWLPISTAPKDGSEMLMSFVGRRPYVTGVKWHSGCFVQLSDYCPVESTTATGWMRAPGYPADVKKVSR